MLFITIISIVALSISVHSEITVSNQNFDLNSADDDSVFLNFLNKAIDCSKHVLRSYHLDERDLIDSIAEQVLNKSLIKLAPCLENLNFPHFTVNSGLQDEFGLFIINMENITMSGMEEIVAEIISMNVSPPAPLEIKNLTLYIPHIKITATNYTLDGHVTFPIGNKVLPLSGTNGKFNIGMDEMRISCSIVLSKNTSGLFVDDLVVLVNASSMSIDVDNLMGGGDIGWSFNTVLNDAAIVAFNYYKDPLVSLYSENTKRLIEAAICEMVPIIC